MSLHLSLQTLTLLSISQMVLPSCVSPIVSIWEAFCNEEKLYTPYVRVFQKGRQGALLRDRGPGFIDLEGLTDIYVCTNGLVMMYYAKTTAMGEVFENGELHWEAHHCELYNPSVNNGMKGDYPRKCLLSILLIGHPHDYRLPALQMFMAPLYDRKYGKYVNATSLIMVGSDGECLIEKGSERARLRVRLARSKAEDEAIDTVNKAATTAEAVQKYPPMFCKLDVQRKLGQPEKGLITLARPHKTVKALRKNPSYFLDTDFVKANPRKETGSNIAPRFKASETGNYTGDEDKIFAEVADQVYAALLDDRSMHFVGCLRYPLFSDDQAQIIFTKAAEYENLNEDNETAPFTPKDSGNVTIFWEEIPTSLPWGKQDATGEKRYVLYDMASAVEEKLTLDYNKTLEAVKTAEDALQQKVEDAAKETEPDKKKTITDEIKDKLEPDVKKAKCKLSFWPYMAAYNELYAHVKVLLNEMKNVWKDLKTELFKEENTLGVASINPRGKPMTETVALKPDELAKYRMDIMQEMSQIKFNRRYEPYNRELVAEYDALLGNYTEFTAVLQQTSQKNGPLISNAETLTSRYKVYKSLTMKAYDDMMNAVKHMERTKGPAPAYHGDPFDNAFVDTMIEIADATKDKDMTPFTDADKEYNDAKACYKLPAIKETCNNIKPSAKRASKMLQNRHGKGVDWAADDLWRQKILNLIEDIFKKVCPYITADFPISINRIVKGYLMGSPAGTGLFSPINGSMLETHDHKYQELVYNSTYMKIAPDNETVNTSAWIPPPKLNPKNSFWDHILEALEHCDENAVPMQFWHNEQGERPAFITYRKYFPNNGSEIHYDVEELLMQEKADQEYSFNWAVEMNWRIFATVLGACMPKYENKIPLISARFYALYSQDFLSPLRQIWMSNRDNPILQVILGNFYATGNGDRWARYCMEASFVESGDRSYRPPRYLYVNTFTEMNYFTTGPLAGSCGMLGMVGNT